MNKIRIFALALSSVMAISTAAGAASFTDMPADPAVSTAIENAVKNGLISGYEDSTVRPDNPIKRSEMAVIITQACKVTKEGDISKFTDVNKEDWFYSAIAKAYEMGAFAGAGDKMNPNDNITVQECFTVLSQVFDLLPPYTRPTPMPDPLPDNTYASYARLYDISSLASYNDATDVANWAIPYVAGVVSNGGWQGVDGNLIPTAYITRAQFASVMDKLIQNYIDEPGTYTELPQGNTMIRCDDVVLDKTVIDGDIYIGDSVSANKITLNNVTSNKRFVIRGCATPKTGEDGKLTYGESGITLTGKYNAVRIIRPYINANLSAIEYTSIFSTEDTNIEIPMSAAN